MKKILSRAALGALAVAACNAQAQSSVTVAGMADAADGAALILGAMGLGAILDDLQSVLAGEGHDHIHVGGPAGQVDDDDRLGARGQRGSWASR